MADKKKAPNRSASRIPPILLLQILEDDRTNHDAGILARLVRGEITKKQAFCLTHPTVYVLAGVLVVFLLYVFINNTHMSHLY